MKQHFSAGGVVCKVLGCALLGFVAISTAGIVIPVVTFAAVGYGIYGLFIFLWTGTWPQGWEKIPAFAKTAASKTWQVLSWPVMKLAQFTSYLVTGVFKISWGTVKFGWTAGTEILCDAILGAALGVLIGIPMKMDKVTVITGAVVGGLIGLGSGIRKWRQPAVTAPVLTPLHIPSQEPPILTPVKPVAPRQLVEA